MSPFTDEGSGNPAGGGGMFPWLCGKEEVRAVYSDPSPSPACYLGLVPSTSTWLALWTCI